MSGLGSWIWGTSQLDDAIDKATSELLPAGGEDIALNLEICDQIRSKSAPAKDAMRALKRRLNHKNPNVQLLALSLTDICIKNGGDLFLAEVSSREFMDNLVSILKIPALNHDVKQTILRFIQNWSIAFEGKQNLSYVGQVYRTLTNEGYKFPPKDLVVANSAMVDTQTAPEWIDSEVCLRCRTPFSFTNRKHHCRNCGQVFDQTCSAKTMALPHFGITQEVRVCDGCHSKLTKKAEKVHKAHRHSTSAHGHRHKSARELADAELQRAIQLSLEEVNGTSGRSRSGYVPAEPSPSKWSYSEPPIVDRSTYPSRKPAQADEDDDPDLRAAIEASLREASAPKPSAPVVVETPRSAESSYSYPEPGYSQSYASAHSAQPVLPELPNYDLQPLEADAILTFNQTVEQVQAQGGRDLSRYPAVTELYDKASGLRPKLALSLDDAGRKEQMLTDMHDKLSQAVKLYDQILTQQIAQPRWRTSSVAYQPQQQNQGYAVNGYSQWASQPANQTGYQTYGEPQPMSPRESYAPPPGLNSSPELTQTQQYQQQPYQQPVQPQQPQYAPPAPITSPPPGPQQAPQYAQAQYQPYATTTPAGSIQSPGPASYTQAPPSISTSAYYAAAPAPPPNPPVTLPQSPPPVSQYQAANTQSPPARTSSLAYSGFASPPPQAPVPNAPPAQAQQPRQQYQAPPQQQQQQQQQPQYHVASPPPAVVALPQFPSAPTNIPQSSFSAYAPSPGFEKKEALLIDL
ncbi:hypothetical protein BJ912DRAFT_887687 [Pholiota molesta]|nr:hypothetical protein BJ912DRAFT_887687 [Pholiota molesta]